MKKTSQHVPRQAKYYDLYGAYKEKNVVILGASGFIGRWLARALSKNGAHVFLFVRDKLAANIIFNQYEINGIIFEHDLVANEASLRIFSKQFHLILFSILLDMALTPTNVTKLLPIRLMLVLLKQFVRQ